MGLDHLGCVVGGIWEENWDVSKYDQYWYTATVPGASGGSKVGPGRA